MFLAVSLFVICITVVSAQTVVNGTNSATVQNDATKSKQQFYEARQASTAQSLTVPAEKRIKSTPAVVSPAQSKATIPNTNKLLKPLTMQQLLLERKKATDKGLPTEEYDKAIIELNLNLAK